MAKNKIIGEVKKKISPNEVRKRGYKLLLYADNPQHMSVLRKIRRDEDLRKHYVGCWHVRHDADGKEIVKGEDKKHAHIILAFDDARWWGAICRTLGFVKPDGEPDTQFCRAIGCTGDGKETRRKETIEGGYVYLIHANAPDKEQYSEAALFGDPRRIEDAKAAITAYRMRRITLAESLDAIRIWVNEQYGKIISPNMFIQWVVKTPYVRSAQNPWVRQMIQQHNAAIYRVQHADLMQQYSDGYRELVDRQQIDFAEWEGLLPEDLAL